MQQRLNSADTQRAQVYAQRIPYAFARTHGVLPAGDDGDAVSVLMRADATGEGLAELRRVLQRPLTTRVVGADEFAAALARAYNSGAAASAISEDLSRGGDLSRLLQDLPAT
ncbi:MAG: hypothetical protein ABI294_07370, partial [Casimicrobiaceae bacterium]